MPHDITLISTVAVGFVLAFVLGYAASRFQLPPLIGYLLAGVAIGPFTPGFVADSAIAGQLAEIGVMLLMFGVGLHFSAADLLAVRRIAVPGAIFQIVLATLLGAGMAMFWGWSFGGGLVLGLSLSVASTVVLLKALEERNAVGTPTGRIAIGWLIVEDLAMVLALVLLPAFAGALGGKVPDGEALAEGGLLLTLTKTLAKVVAFVLVAIFLGPRVMPWLLRQVARTGSRELFTLCVLAAAIGIAFASAKIFDVSFALGAFFAGVILSESDLSHKAAENSLPLQDAFAVLFFVSVGMLFDPRILWESPLHVLGVLLLILVGKSVIALGVVLLLRFPLSAGLTVAASLAQVGEFSFILAGLGLSYGLLPAEGFSLVLGGALLSIALNPLAFSMAERIGRKLHGTEWHQRLEVARAPQMEKLQGELEHVKKMMEEKSASHRTVSPTELIARFPFFEPLTQEQREVLLLHFESQTAQPGERLIRAGDKADMVYFIAQGEVEVVPRVRQNRIKLGAGSYFGEMALLSGERRSADVTALDYSKFLTLSERDFRRFLAKYPFLREQMVAQAAARGAMNAEALARVQAQAAAEAAATEKAAEAKG